MQNRYILLTKKIFNAFLFCFLVSLSSCKDNVSLNSPDGLIIIIKADDLGDTTANWNRFIKMVDDNKICAGIGVISGRVSTEGTKSEMRRIADRKQENNFPIIEFWNHGYDHSKINNITEFSGGDMTGQLNHIQMAQNFLHETFNATCHTFGAPFNRTSGVTGSALAACPDINVWLCYQNNEKHFLDNWKDPNKKVINNNDQHIILNVDYLFLNNFPIGNVINNYMNDKEKPYILIQIHPAKWDNYNFNEFEKLIHFYKDRHLATFMTPYQYFQYLHKVYNANGI